jgi:hypothetical protein
LPFRTKAELWASGRWGKGGVALLREGDWHGLVKLPPALFAVLAILILAAKRAAADASWAGGFVTAEELCRRLTRHTRGTDNVLLPDTKHAIRYIFRLRRALAKILKGPIAKTSPTESIAGIKLLKPSEWAKRLIELQPFLGYRLSAPPEGLQLEILKDLPGGEMVLDSLPAHKESAGKGDDIA